MLNIFAASDAVLHAASLNKDGKINLKGSWDEFANALPKSIDNLMGLLAIIGMLFIAWALIKWAWDRRKSGGMGMGGGGGGGISGALIVGVVLSAPGFVIPAVLGVLDLLINALVSIWNNTNPAK